jgi:hypothetical protein
MLAHATSVVCSVELLTIQLRDIAVSHPELKNYYPEMGTAEPLRG